MAEKRRGVLRALLGESEDGDLVRVLARYDSADPFAVTLQFVGAPAGSEWVFARDLLVDVLLWGQAGTGDVQFRAEWVCGDWVWLILDSPDGHSEMCFRTDDVWDLARRIERCVPAGKVEIDVSAELAELMDGEAA